MDRSKPPGAHIALAVESEWYNVSHAEPDKAARYAKDVARDFYKLLVVKASYKLMIISSKGESMRRLVVKQLLLDYANYTGPKDGEHFFLLDSLEGDLWSAAEFVGERENARVVEVLF